MDVVKRGGLVLALMLGLGVLATEVRADLVTLQDLIDGQSLVVGDKVFTNFSYLPAALAGDPIIPEASQIVVRGVAEGNEVTISFQGFWESVYPEISDTFLQFDVIVNDPSRAITGVSLFAPGLSVTGLGRVRIDETIKTLDNQLLGDLTVATTIGQISDSTWFEGQRAIRVSKDIAVFAGRLPSDSSAGLSYFEQSFRQTTFIPEPAAVGLLGTGVVFVGALALGRRRMG